MLKGRSCIALTRVHRSIRHQNIQLSSERAANSNTIRYNPPLKWIEIHIGYVFLQVSWIKRVLSSAFPCTKSGNERSHKKEIFRNICSPHDKEHRSRKVLHFLGRPQPLQHFQLCGNWLPHLLPLQMHFYEEWGLHFDINRRGWPLPRARRRAIANPIPAVDAVTTAVFPTSLRIAAIFSVSVTSVTSPRVCGNQGDWLIH
jgi:hypothetical protein